MNANRIIFMGTPDFAVGTLNALVKAGHNVVAVVTAPDRPAGRGRQPKASAVKERALELGLPVLQPERLKAPEFLASLDALDASIYIVVAFRMLPEVVWNKPPLGTINLHASLLPNYRGAAPINWAVINGEARSGVTTFRIQHEIDTGDILLQEQLAIGPEVTAGELHDRMMETGAALMVRTVEGLIAGSLVPRPQEKHGQLQSAPKIGPETCHIDFARTAKQVHDLVRGMSPYPGAWCMWTEIDKAPTHFKLLRTKRTERLVTAPIGTVRMDQNELLIACADHWIEALEVQPEGRKRMSAADFMRGMRVHGHVVLR
jgi:methionyl-tRNA formyltransferase